MQLLFVNRFFHPDQSATAQMLTELAEDLAARGERVTVITGRVAYLGGDILLPARETHRGIEIRRVRSSSFGRDRRLGRLADYLSFYGAATWAALRLGRQDGLVVLSDPPLLSVLALGVRALKRLKTVCWLQDVFPEIAIRSGVLPKGLLARLLQWFSLWSLRRIDRTVVLGRCMERHIGPEESEVAAVIREAGCGDVIRQGDGQGAAEAPPGVLSGSGPSGASRSGGPGLFSALLRSPDGHGEILAPPAAS